MCVKWWPRLHSPWTRLQATQNDLQPSLELQMPLVSAFFLTLKIRIQHGDLHKEECQKARPTSVAFTEAHTRCHACSYRHRTAQNFSLWTANSDCSKIISRLKSVCRHNASITLRGVFLKGPGASLLANLTVNISHTDKLKTKRQIHHPHL